MEAIVMFKSYDGSVFNTREECLTHELKTVSNKGFCIDTNNTLYPFPENTENIEDIKDFFESEDVDFFVLNKKIYNRLSDWNLYYRFEDEDYLTAVSINNEIFYFFIWDSKNDYFTDFFRKMNFYQETLTKFSFYKGISFNYLGTEKQ